VDPDILLAMQRQAVLNPTEQTPFKTKHLNIWCAARIVWMPLEIWDPCCDTQLEEDEFVGDPYLAILDLASKDDIAAYTKLFTRVLEGRRHHYFFTKYYLPASVLEIAAPNQTAYKRWSRPDLHRDGRVWLTLHPGKEIDFNLIEEDVKKDKDRFQMLEVLYDPWRATHLVQNLAKEGAVTVEMRQVVGNLSAPMKELLAAAKGHRVHHDGNPITRWMYSNVTALLDAKDNIYPRKEKPHMKIDGPVTHIMGMAKAMLAPTAGTLDDYLRDPVFVGRPKQ
jgi:phage terminase large subunit-like protein